MKDTNIVAFLQNMWVREPMKVEAMLKRHVDDPMFWNRICKGFLFSGCLTGKKIKKAFPQYHIDIIIWDECTKEIADSPQFICKPDHQHIEDTLFRLNPFLVLTFGDIAYKALSKFPVKIIKCPHPASRYPDTMHKLKMAAVELTELMHIKYCGVNE